MEGKTCLLRCLKICISFLSVAYLCLPRIFLFVNSFGMDFVHHMSVNAHKLSLWWSLFVSEVREGFWKLGKLRALLDQCLAWRFVLVTFHHEVSFTLGGHSSISQHCTDVNSYFLGWFHVEGHMDAEFPTSLTSRMSWLWYNLTSAAVFRTEEVSWYTHWWCMAYTVQ
jgi:hypothetical protein